MYKHNYPIALLRHLQRTTLLSALATLLLTGCGMVEGDEGDCTPTNDSRTYVQVRVQVATGESTRGPQGGEDGDGREPGVYQENDINNVTLLFYKGGNGINTASATIEAALYFSTLTPASDKSYYTTGVREVPSTISTSETYQVLVIANAGDLTYALNGKDLADVRDYLMESAWTAGASITEYKDFVMSSSEDASIDFKTGSGTREDPFKTNATIERIAARIDFIPNATAATHVGSESGLVYAVVNSNDESQEIGYYVLTHVVPFNQLNSGSYLIKRVWDATNGTTYLDDENPNPSGPQTNYVVDPYWPDHAAAGYTRPYTSASAAKADATNLVADQWAVTTGLANVKTSTLDDNYYILDYTQENTQNNGAATSVAAAQQYATGLIFYGTYYTTDEYNDGSPTTTGTPTPYVYYLRHSDPDDNGTYTDVMHYGIVRNNIYRVKISKILDTPSGMQITINVRQWALYKHPGIVM